MESVASVKNWPTAVKDYYNELKLEMRRVTWPTRAQVESTTIVVLFTVFAFGAYFWVVDGVLSSMITHIFRFFTHAALPQ